MSSGISDPLPPPVTKAPADYTGLITPWQSTKARFVATVSAGVAPCCDAQAFVAGLPAAFDIDYAVGAQLDVVGQWVGRSRFVPVPLPANFFSFDAAALGFDQAYWKGPYDSAEGISALPDTLYRRLLYTKVAANSWDGTTDGAEAILRTYFIDPATLVFVDDGGRAVPPLNQFSLDVLGSGFDQGVWHGPGQYPAMLDAFAITYTIGIAGKLPTDLDLYLLNSDLIPVKAMGARVEYAVTTVNGAPLFGFDVQNGEISGFDSGAWGASPAVVAAQTP